MSQVSSRKWKLLERLKLTQLKSCHQSRTTLKDVSSQLFFIETLFWDCLDSRVIELMIDEKLGLQGFLACDRCTVAKFRILRKLPIEFAEVLKCAGEAQSHGMAVCLPHTLGCAIGCSVSHIFIPLPTQPALFNLAASSESDKILLTKFFSCFLQLQLSWMLVKAYVWWRS